jgi:signal recognition particle GTPase
MTTHRNLQNEHEKAVLNAFKEHLLAQNKNLQIISMPDPPDAIVKLDNQDTWVEITDAMFNSDIARSVTSYAADDKIHKPAKGGLVIDPTEKCSKVIQEVIEKKLVKKTLKDHKDKHGQGILIVGLNGPFFDISTAYDDLSEEFKEKLKSQDMFTNIYFYEPHQSQLQKIH